MLSIIEFWTVTLDPSRIPIPMPKPHVFGGVPLYWLRVATFFTVPEDADPYTIPMTKMFPELLPQGTLFPALSTPRLLMLTVVRLITATCAARLPKPSAATKPPGACQAAEAKRRDQATRRRRDHRRARVVGVQPR